MWFKKKKSTTKPIQSFLDRDFSICCQMLWDGYTLNEIKQELQSGYDFEKFILHHGFSCNEILAIYQYSISSNMMLGLARKQATKAQIKNSILNNLKQRIKDCVPDHLYDEIIQNIQLFLITVDTSKSYKELDAEITTAGQQIGIPPIYLKTTIVELLRLERTDKSLTELYTALSKHSLPSDMILYRGVKSKYLTKNISDMHQLVGKTIANTFATSTTYDKSAGFIKNKDVDLVFELHVPKGTKGLNIENISNYNCEKEVLLSGHNLYITNVEKQLIENHIGEPMKKWYVTCDVLPLDTTTAIIIDGGIQNERL